MNRFSVNRRIRHRHPEHWRKAPKRGADLRDTILFGRVGRSRLSDSLDYFVTQYKYLLERMNNCPSLTAGVLLKSP